MDDVVAVVTDLFFQSRIASAARASNRAVRFAGDVDRSSPFALALVDLEARTDVLAAIRTLKEAGSGPIVAFGPHVDTERRKAARGAGASRVLARSKFVSELPLLLAGDRSPS